MTIVGNYSANKLQGSLCKNLNIFILQNYLETRFGYFSIQCSKKKKNFKA